MTKEAWGMRPSYLTQGTELVRMGDSVMIASGRGRRWGVVAAARQAS
jgi:hypothetical protein